MTGVTLGIPQRRPARHCSRFGRKPSEDRSGRAAGFTRPGDRNPQFKDFLRVLIHSFYALSMACRPAIPHDAKHGPSAQNTSRRNRMKHLLTNTKTGLTLVVDNTDPTGRPSDPHACGRRRKDRELKRELFVDMPLYGPSPNKLPWEFLRAA